MSESYDINSSIGLSRTKRPITTPAGPHITPLDRDGRRPYESVPGRERLRRTGQRGNEKCQGPRQSARASVFHAIV